MNNSITKKEILRLLQAITNEINFMSESKFEERFKSGEMKFRSHWKPNVVTATFTLTKAEDILFP